MIHAEHQGPLHDLVTGLTQSATELEEQPPPGVCVAVRLGDQDYYALTGDAQRLRGTGVPDTPRPLTLDTRVDLGSVTKIVATTSAVMALVDAGELDTSERLAALLPVSARAEASRGLLDIRVEDLLRHRAGLWEWWPLYLTSRHDEAIAQVLHRAPRYPRDQARHYSDLGFILLGAVVSRLVAAPLADAVGDLVLAPYGLAATRYARPAPGAAAIATSLGDTIERRMVRTGRPYPVAPTEAKGFDGWREHVLVGEVNDGNAFHAFASVAGHAGLFSTVPDLLCFGTAILDSLAGTGPVRAATARRFVAPGPDSGQALGFRRWTSRVDGCEATAIGHTGFPGIAVAVLPTHRATVVLSTNRLHVTATPRATEPMWTRVLAGTHAYLHELGATPKQNPQRGDTWI